jgi:hypothetical protein
MHGVAEIGGKMDDVVPSRTTILIVREHIAVRLSSADRTVYIRGGQEVSTRNLTVSTPCAFFLPLF